MPPGRPASRSRAARRSCSWGCPATPPGSCGCLRPAYGWCALEQLTVLTTHRPPTLLEVARGVVLGVLELLGDVVGFGGAGRSREPVRTGSRRSSRRSAMTSRSENSSLMAGTRSAKVASNAPASLRARPRVGWRLHPHVPGPPSSGCWPTMGFSCAPGSRSARPCASSIASGWWSLGAPDRRDRHRGIVRSAATHDGRVHHSSARCDRDVRERAAILHLVLHCDQGWAIPPPGMMGPLERERDSTALAGAGDGRTGSGRC